MRRFLWCAIRAPVRHHFLTFIIPSLFALVLALLARPAFAATEYTGPTFTYNNTVYPATLVGSTVTFNANPSAPDSYGMGASGYNIVWTSGSWYAVDAAIGSDHDRGQYFMSESSKVTNPWYITLNASGSTTSMDGIFYDANHGWGGFSSVRTVTFGESYSFADMSHTADVPLLYHHGFIRYIVDNSDWRDRYTIQSSQPSVPMTGNTTIGWITSLGSSSSYFAINTIINGQQPQRVVFWYSPDNSSGSWEKLGTLTSPSATSSAPSYQYIWSVQRSGYYAVWAYAPNASAPAYVFNSEYVTYNETDNPSTGGSGSGGSGGTSDPSNIIQQALNTLRSIYNAFTGFFDGLLGWLPSDIRYFFMSIVALSLIIGLFSIIRGS